MTSDPEPGVRWFYVEDGRRKGPVGVPQLVELILGGRLAEDALVWRSGLEAWVPADSIEEVRRELPPPIPGDEEPGEREDAREAAERLAEAAEGPGPEEAAGEAPPGQGRRKRRHRRNRPARSRPRWLVPLVVMVVVVIVVLWYLLRRINEVPPGQIILQGSLASPASPGPPELPRGSLGA